VLIKVGGCEMYSDVCACRLSVHVYFYVCSSSDDCEVEKVGVAVDF
jgi:hypothetical protein